MVDSETARREKEAQEAPKRKITLKNTSAKGHRFVFDATGKQHQIGPGQEVEVEVAEPVADGYEKASKNGSDVVVSGHEPEEAPKNEAAPEIPKEQESRLALAAAERDLMEEGQEADKDRREKAAKKTGYQLAAETGIHMHARGEKPEVVALPPDADTLPKKNQNQPARRSSSSDQF